MATAPSRSRRRYFSACAQEQRKAGARPPQDKRKTRVSHMDQCTVGAFGPATFRSRGRYRRSGIRWKQDPPFASRPPTLSARAEAGMAQQRAGQAGVANGAASARDGVSREPMTEDTTSAKISILTLRSIRPAACAASARIFRADGNSAIVRSPAGDARGESTSARLKKSDALPPAGDVT